MDTTSAIVPATCPICHVTREYGSELVGRYTYCLNCKARFYVEVPTLDAARKNQPIVPPAEVKPNTTLDDLMRDSQAGQRYIIDSIRRQENAARRTRGLLLLCLLVGLGNLAALAYLLMR